MYKEGESGASWGSLLEIGGKQDEGGRELLFRWLEDWAYRLTTSSWKKKAIMNILNKHRRNQKGPCYYHQVFPKPKADGNKPMHEKLLLQRKNIGYYRSAKWWVWRCTGFLPWSLNRNRSHGSLAYSKNKLLVTWYPKLHYLLSNIPGVSCLVMRLYSAVNK